MMSRTPSISGLRSAGEVEGTGAVVQERRVVDPQCERDRRVRLVSRRADRVEAPAVLLEPARGVVGLPAVDLGAPDLLDLGRRGAQRGARLERSQRARGDAPRAGRARRRRLSTWARRASPLRGDRLLHLGAPLACGRERVHARAVHEHRLRGIGVRGIATPRSGAPTACSARPYENDSGHGPPIWLIALRFSVASTSDWPPERKTIPGIAAGTWIMKHSHRALGDPLRRRLLRTALSGDHHVRLEQSPAQVDALDDQLVERPLAACAT